MRHRRVLNEGEGPAHPYLTLPEIAAVLYAKEGSPQTGGTLHYTSKKVHEVYRRHADEFLFDSGSGTSLASRAHGRGFNSRNHRCRPCFLHDNMPDNGQTPAKLSDGAAWCRAPVRWFAGE